MLRCCSPLTLWRPALLASIALLVCAAKRLEQQTVPAFARPSGTATRLPPGRRVMADGGSDALAAQLTPQGTVVAMEWSGGASAGADRRWRYALYPSDSDGAWTWESPAGQGYGDLSLGSGAEVDLLVEARAPGETSPARWLAIDREHRKPLAEGALAGARCGEVSNVGGDRFVFTVGARVLLWRPGLTAPVSLAELPATACLGAARGAGDTWELLWTQGEDRATLWRGTLTLGQDQALSGVDDLAWPDAEAPLRLGQRLRVRDGADNSFSLVYQARGTGGLDGLREAHFGSSGAPEGTPQPLTDAVGCGDEAHPERWDLVDGQAGPLILRCEPRSATTPTSGELPLRALPTSPGLRELALRYEGDGALLCGPVGCDLWSEAVVDGSRKLVRSRLGPVEPLDLAREASARDLAASAVYGLLHTDADPSGVLTLAARTCITRDAIDRRLGASVPSGASPPAWTWDEPEGVVRAAFSPATGCLDQIDVRRKPPPRH